MTENNEFATDEIDELDETNTEDENEDPIDYAEVEQQIDELHQMLDEVKTSGRGLGEELIENLAHEEMSDHQEQLINRAFLLYKRVEFGDKQVRWGNE